MSTDASPIVPTSLRPGVPETVPPLPPTPPGPPASLLYRVARAMIRCVTTLTFDLKVYGTQNVPAEGGVLLAPNHESYLDPPLVGVQLRRPVSFFAKSELFEVPVFGEAIRRVHAFPVRQGQGDVGAVKEAISRLKEGHVLSIFPEGSRSPDGQLQPIEPGVALIVRRAQVPLIPVAISGSFQAWPRHKSMFRAHPIRVMFGPPLIVHHMKPNQIVRVVDQELRRMLAELRAMR